MAKFDFGAECAKVAVKGAVKVTVDGVSFTLQGKTQAVITDEEISFLAGIQEKEVAISYPKQVTKAGKKCVPVKHVNPLDLREKLDAHTEANTDEEDEKQVA